MKSKSGQQEDPVQFQNPNQRTFGVCETFLEIMNGPNPLTKEEIQKLVEKRPHLYSVLRKGVK